MRFAISLFAIPLVLLAACADGARPPEDGASNVVTITAKGLTFDGPTSVAPGWTTFRFVNASTMTHFAILERLPAGTGIADQQREVAPVFQEGMNLLVKGDAKAANAKFGELPEWFGKIVFTGGPGLTAPGRTSETTVHLEPGNYLLECYVKTNGIFHSYNPDPAVFGMVHELKVAGDPSRAPEPEAAVHVRISSEKGIEVEGTPTPGPQTVAVTFEDQKVHENFVGHDVHLVRLDEGIDLDALAAWMDWTRPDGLQTPAPATFLGGVEEMPSGSTGYFTATLEPGRYAWIAEVPSPEEKGMLKVFAVAPGKT
jgi:hypothetical protein